MNRSLFSGLASAVIVLSLLLFQNLNAEISISGQNEARYARGALPDSGDYNYFHNYLELTVSHNNLRGYARQSYLLPSEFNSEWQSGLFAFDKRYIEYRPKNFSIRGGNFYKTWGRGLLFGTVELIDLDYDNGLDGVLAGADINDLEINLYRGVEVDTAGVIQEAAEGIYLTYDLPWDVYTGFAMTQLDSVSRHPGLNRFGFEIGGDLADLSYYAVYSEDHLDTDPVQYRDGFYGALSAYLWDTSILFDYKRYNMLTYGGKLGSTPLQFAPTVVPEITMYLLDHHPRQQHFGDDVGYQFEINKTINEYSVKLNLSQSSEQDDGGFLPQLAEEFSPYYSVFAQVEYDDYSDRRYVLQSGLHEDVEFTKTATGGFSNWFKRFGSGIIYERRFASKYSITTDIQFMIVDEVNRDKIYIDEFMAVTFGRSPDITGTVLLERSESGEETGGIREPGWLVRSKEGRLWPGMELTYNFKPSNQLRLFVGHERGGLKCTGGICRWVNPFKGIKFTLTSQF